MPAASSAPDQPEQPSFVALRLWLADSPWRLSGGWLLLAGWLAAGGVPTGQPWLPLVLALVLAEVVWGALWSQLVPSHAWPLHQARRRPGLPYVQPGSPAARLLGWPDPGPAAAIVRAGLPLVALALLLGLAIGWPALLASGLVVLIVLLAMAAQRAGLAGMTGWLQALVQAALPCALGVSLAGPWPVGPHGAWLAGLALGFTLLARALISGRSQAAGDAQRLLVAAAGAAAVVAVLLLNGQPVAAGLAGLLAAAPLLMLARPTDRTARAAQPWLLALLLVSALALGTGIG